MKRGLVLEGGGAKGSYAFGCLRALASAGIKFDAVAGTSVGALNAALWATGSLQWGEDLWRTISHANVYSRRLPVWLDCILLRVAIFCSVVTQYAVGMAHLPEEARRDTVKLQGVWATLSACAVSVIPPAWSWELYVTTFVTFLCVLGVKQGTFRIVVAVGAPAWPVLTAINTLSAGRIAVATLPLAVLIVARVFCSWTLRESAPLRSSLELLSSQPFTIPCYATVAYPKEIWSDTDAWVDLGGEAGPMYEPATDVRYIPKYVRVDLLEPEERTKALLASAAVPLGIVQPVLFQRQELIDGGTADNIPLLPLTDYEQCDEIWILRLNEGEFDAQRHCDTVRQILIASERRIPKSREEYFESEEWRLEKKAPELRPLPTIVPHVPSERLGGLFSGTLNFTAEYAVAKIELGFAAMMEQLRADARLCGATRAPQ